MQDFLALIASPTDPAVLRELVLVVPLVFLAALLARAVRRRSVSEAQRLHGEGARRLALPLIAVGLLTLARFITHHLGWHGNVIGIAIELGVAMAGIRIVLFAVRHAFASPRWLDSHERTLASLLWLGVALNLLGILPEFIDWLDSFSLHIGRSHITVWQILRGVVTVFITLVAAMWLGGVAETRLATMVELDTSLRVVFSRILKAVLFFFAILLGMSLAGLDITTLSVFGGALGVGLGLGMQKIASNYVSGFIILLDRSIRIGNLIQVGPEQRGEVLQITTRYTVLRGLHGMHYIVPNELLVSTVVQNETFGINPLRVAVMMQISHASDVEKALDILEEVAQAESRVLPDPAPKAYLSDFTEHGIRLELAIWIADPLKGSLEVRSNIQRAALRRFAQAGIDMAQSQKTVRQVESPAT